MNFPPALGALLCTSALLLAAACGANGGETSTSDGQSGRLNIVVAFYPFQFITERIAGPDATVQSLTQPGAEPHDVELTPRQVASVGTADFVLYEKSFQAAVDEAVTQSGNQNALDTTSVVPLQDTGAIGNDPHVWLDPTNVATIAAAVTEKLITIDPDNAAEYAKNAAALKLDLGTLDQDFTQRLGSCKRTAFITSHAAFGYLANRYGLTQIGISGLSPDGEPSPARIAEVQTEARERGITTIFYETLVSPSVAEAIAGDLDLKTDVLDPIEGITPDSKGQDYLAVMNANLTALETANECS